uniref:Adenylate kinase 7 n=1 Tax=Timema bartmani TaxID=61472 RepID=A0A7R9I320_9NEOP|nr:unnamed protein product [Timema bartmani]
MATTQQMKEENSKSIIEDVLDKPEDSVSIRESLSLDDIFGFSEAKHLSDEKKMEIVEEPKFIPYRVFINHIDSFHGRHISNFLSEQVYGATKPLQEEDEEEIKEVQEEEEEEYYDEEKEEGNKVKVQNLVIKNNYEIIGTLQDPDYKLPEGIKEIVTNTSDRESFSQKLVKCGAIVYDITNDPGQISEALWALKALQHHLDNMKHDTPKAYNNLKETRHFILISTMMTWALTKPIDPDEPELPFTEEDYRRRKPHPNFKEHINLEKEVIKTGNKHKDLYKTVVIATALTYGAEEDVLHFLFKMAWDNEPFLPIFASGQNKLPLVHIKDLTSIVHNVLEKFPDKVKFIFALDVAVSTLKQIVKAISKVLGSGKIKKVPKEEAFLYPQVTQTIYDMLTVNLNMEPVLAVDMKWISETVFVENVPQVVTEYKDARGLKTYWNMFVLVLTFGDLLSFARPGKDLSRPEQTYWTCPYLSIAAIFLKILRLLWHFYSSALKIFVHGPPAVGKTILSKKLCEHYKVHYLSKDNVVEEAVNKLFTTQRDSNPISPPEIDEPDIYTTCPLMQAMQEYQGDAPLALAAITQLATPDSPDPLTLFSEDGICLANSNGSMGYAIDFRELAVSFFHDNYWDTYRLEAGLRDHNHHNTHSLMTGDTAKQVKEKERDQEDKEEADEEEEEEEDEMQENLEEMYDLLEEVQANMAENEGQLDDSYLMSGWEPPVNSNERMKSGPQLFQSLRTERLLSNPCQNQGYVLDGFPQVLEQARVLFENVEDDEETAEEEQDSEIPFNKNIMPDQGILTRSHNPMMVRNALVNGSQISVK